MCGTTSTKRQANNKGPWAICKKCNHGMQGIVSRMQKHLESCNRTVTTTSTDPDVIEIPSTPSTALGPSNAKQQRIDSFVSNTSAQESDQLDVLVARFFIATNTPFNRVEHPTSLALVSAPRSSYRPLNRHVIAEDLVNKATGGNLPGSQRRYQKSVERFWLARRLLDLWKDFSAHSVGLTRRNETDSGLRKPEKWSFA